MCGGGGTSPSTSRFRVFIWERTPTLGHRPFSSVVPTTHHPPQKFINTHKATLRLARARPSLLTPLAGSIGFGLRCLTQMLPGTAPVAKGLLASIETAMDDGVRSLIAREQQEEKGGAATANANANASASAVVKALLKGRRDAVAGGLMGEASGDAGGGGGSGADPVAQGTQLLCGALLKGAARV